MSHFIYRFVYGLKSEIGDMIKRHSLCWQNKPIDEVLRLAKYCSDEIEAKHRQLEERTMWDQVKLAEQQQALLKKEANTNQAGTKENTNREKGPYNREEAKKKFPCNNCGELGHWRNECKKPLQPLKPNNDNVISFPQVQTQVSTQAQPSYQIPQVPVAQFQVPPPPMPHMQGVQK